jgi:hypothetical protein
VLVLQGMSMDQVKQTLKMLRNSCQPKAGASMGNRKKTVFIIICINNYLLLPARTRNIFTTSIANKIFLNFVGIWNSVKQFSNNWKIWTLPPDSECKCSRKFIYGKHTYKTILWINLAFRDCASEIQKWSNLQGICIPSQVTSVTL